MAGRALVIGATGGIGGALGAALRGRGDEVVALSRAVDGFDLTDPDGVDRAMQALQPPFDLVLLATGALEIGPHLPEKSLRQVTAQGLAAQFTLNAIGPALVMRALPRLLPRDRRAVFAVLSARVGSIGDNRAGGWYAYRAAKAALNQLLRCAAIEMARTNPRAICVALHPGTVATQFTRKYLGRHPAVAPELAAARLLAVTDGLDAASTGGFFDYAGREIPW